MINLNSTSELLQLITGSAISTMVTTDFIDITSSGTSVPSGINDQIISTAATTTIVAAPAANTQRKIYGLRIYNNGATTQTVTIQRYNGATAYTVFFCNNLAANYTLVYDDTDGWKLFNASGIQSLTGVFTLTGTTNRLSVDQATGNVTLNIDTAYVGQSTITTLGTVATGTWSATTIALNKGGTGQTTAAAAMTALSPITTTGDIIYSSSGTTNSRLGIGSTGQVLEVVAGVPAWTALKFTMNVELQAGDNGQYYFTLNSIFPFTIDKAYYQTVAGTITANVKINSTSVTSLSALALSSTPGNTSSTGASTVAAGDSVSVTFTSNSSATYAAITLQCTRTG